MSAPSQAAGVMPHEWTGPEMRPPAYACLQGTEVRVELPLYCFMTL